MEIPGRLIYDNLDIKVNIGNLIINLININFEPPRFPWHTKNHCHSSYELHFIPSGKGTLKTCGATYVISPGTFYLTGPGIYHEQYSHKENPMTEYCLNFDFELINKKTKGEDINSQQEVNEIIKPLSNIKFWFGNDEFNCAGLCQNIIDELDNHYIGYYHKIQTLISQIIIDSARCFANNKHASYSLPVKSLDAKRRQLLDGFFRQYNQTFSAGIIADMLGVSLRHLDRIMLQYYGMPFKKKLIKTRIDQAKDLLQTTDLSVQQVAEQVGFTSHSYFCKRFKECENLSPTEFRQKSKLL